MLIDSHTHIVSADFERYPPTPLSGTLDRKLDDPITVELLLHAMDALQIERAVLVQRAHVYGYHNDYVVDAAARYPSRLVAVGCVDAADPQGPERVRYWVRERGAVGIRLTEPHKGSGTGWLASAAALDTWRAATELRISVCLHMYRWNRVESLVALLDVLRVVPTAQIVIDHVSNFAAEEGPPHHGVDAPLAALVAFPAVSLKFSMINLSKLAAQGIDAAPAISQVVQMFGADRVMWGSDIGQSTGSYASLLDLGRAATKTLSSEHQIAAMGATAQRVYWGVGKNG